MQIRMMEPRDVDAVMDLYGQVFGEEPWNESWDEAAIREVLATPTLLWWVAIENDRVIGFVAGATSSYNTLRDQFSLPTQINGFSHNIAYLAELGVHRDYRRKHIARGLTQTFLDMSRHLRATEFLVRTRPGTGNYPWYLGKLQKLFTYDDGRTIFYAPSIPSNL